MSEGFQPLLVLAAVWSLSPERSLLTKRKGQNSELRSLILALSILVSEGMLHIPIDTKAFSFGSVISRRELPSQAVRQVIMLVSARFTTIKRLWASLRATSKGFCAKPKNRLRICDAICSTSVARLWPIRIDRMKSIVMSRAVLQVASTITLVFRSTIRLTKNT